jgi:hypothetical protein
VTASPEEATKPPGVVFASFWILLLSAALRVVAAVLTLVTWNSFVQRQLQAPLPAHTTRAQTVSAIHTYLTVNIVLDVVFALLYVLFAYRVRQGRTWARLAITVIVVVFGLFDILSGTDGTTLAIVLIELVAVALLWTPSARQFFPTRRPPA